MDRMRDQGDDKLDGFFAEYRMACPDPEPSANFMPGMWKRIEARRTATLSVFRHWAQVCVMATVAATLLIGAVLIHPVNLFQFLQRQTFHLFQGQ